MCISNVKYYKINVHTGFYNLYKDNCVCIFMRILIVFSKTFVQCDKQKDNYDN